MHFIFLGFFVSPWWNSCGNRVPSLTLGIAQKHELPPLRRRRGGSSCFCAIPSVSEGTLFPQEFHHGDTKKPRKIKCMPGYQIQGESGPLLDHLGLAWISSKSTLNPSYLAHK